MKRYGRPILLLVFLALLATPFLMRHFGHRAPAVAPPGEDPLARYGFRLT